MNKSFGFVEENMSFLCRMPNSNNDESNGIELYISDADVNTGEKYALVVKNGYLNKDSSINDNQIQCRISLESAKYLSSDEYLSEEELKWFIESITDNWELIKDNFNQLLDDYQGYKDESGLIWYENVKPFTENDKVPDYSKIEV